MKNDFRAMIALLAAKVFKTTPQPMYNMTGSGSWPGFVPPSACNIAHKKAAHINPKHKRHQGAKECARRVKNYQADYCYNKHMEMAGAIYNRCGTMTNL